MAAKSLDFQTFFKLLAGGWAMLLVTAIGPGMAAQEFDPRSSQADSAVQNVWLARVQVHVGLRDFDSTRVGVRLRLSTTAGTQKFSSLDEIDLGKLRALSFLAGLELLIPLGRYATLRPFADLGVGSTDGRNRSSALAALGVRAELIQRLGSFVIGIEPGVHFNGAWDGEFSRIRNDLSSDVRLDIRHPLGVRSLGSEMDFGIYGEAGYFVDGVEFTSVGGGTGPPTPRWEVGVTTGWLDPRPKVWFIRLPRVRIGWRFGDDFSGLRLRLGGDYLTPIPPIR